MSLSSVYYQPGQPPADPEALPRYLSEELSALARAVTLLAAGHLDVTNVAPTKPRDGDLRYADGTNWNPSAGGEGIYAYYNSTWNRLG